MERVLCVTKSRLEELGIDFNTRGIQALNLKDVHHKDVSFKERAFVDDPNQVEESSKTPQILGYVAIEVCDDVYLGYQRGGSELRLSANTSIGFGGHINPVDAAWTLEETVLTGLARELEEEIGFYNIPLELYEYKGVIIDTDDVGKVHVGVAYVIEQSVMREVADYASDCELKDLLFIDVRTPAEYDKLEGWSQLLADHIKRSK